MLCTVEVTENIFDMTKFGRFKDLWENWTGETINRDKIEIFMPLMFQINVLNMCDVFSHTQTQNLLHDPLSFKDFISKFFINQYYRTTDSLWPLAQKLLGNHCNVNV